MPLKLLQKSDLASPVVVVAIKCDPIRLKVLFPKAVIVHDGNATGTDTWEQMLALARTGAIRGELGPVALVGFSAGCLRIRKLWLDGARPDALLLCDGTHTSLPPSKEQERAWSEIIADGKEALRLVVITHTFNTYVEQLKSPYSSTVGTLRRIMGEPFEMQRTAYTQRFGGMYVSSWPSKACDDPAHARQLNEALPDMVRQYVGPYMGGLRDAMLGGAAATPTKPPEWLRPELTYGQRMIAWSRAEMDAGVAENPPGSNTGPRIRDYLAGCIRHERRLGLTAGQWCAAAASMAAHVAALHGDHVPTWRASGLEMIQDAIASGRWYDLDDVLHGLYVPSIGDLCVLAPSAGMPSWGRHVTRVVQWSPTGFRTIGGNEGNAWAETARTMTPTVLGFARVD